VADNSFDFLDKPTPATPAATPEVARDSALPLPATAGAGSFSFLDSSTVNLPKPPVPETGGFSFLNQPAPPLTGPPIGVNPTVTPSAVDPDKQPWIKKAWDWANAPFFDPEPIKRWTGWTPESGWGKGLLAGSEDLFRGLSSPLSLAFIIGSFGTGGLIEGAGSAVLREAGLGLTDALEVTRGSKVITAALKAGKSTEETLQAVQEAGINARTVVDGLGKLEKAGLTRESLLSQGAIHDVGSAMIRRIPGVSIKQADNVARGIHELVDAGFTIQNAYSAVLTAPRVFDAFKEGDYEDAARFAVDAVGSGAFAVRGAFQGIKTAGHFMPEFAAKMGLRNSPSQENLALINEFGKRDEAVLTDQRAEKLWEEDIRKQYPDMKPADLHRTMKWVMSGESEQEMARRYNSLSESGGRSDRIGESAEPVARRKFPQPEEWAGVTPEILEHHPELKDNPAQRGLFKAILTATSLGNDSPAATNLADQIYSLYKSEGKIPAVRPDGSHWGGDYPTASSAILENIQKVIDHVGGDPKKAYQWLTEKHPVSELREVKGRAVSGKADDLKEGAHVLGTKAGPFFLSVHDAETAESAKPEEGAAKGVRAEPRRGTDEDRIRELVDQHLVQNSKHYNTPAKLDALLDSYDSRKLTPQMKALGKEVATHFGITLEKAQKTGALKDGVEHYVTQLWEKDADNPAANRLRQQSRQGEFAINTPMARHRMFESAFEGELLGHKLRVTDPIQLAAYNGASFADVINNRAFFDRIQDMNIRASDGRPMLAPSVSGHVVEGEGGENPAVLINPNTTRSIRIAEHVAKGLEASGDLKRMIDEGKISKLGKDKEGNNIYGWNPGDYFGLDHPGLRAWRYATQDTAGNPAIVNADLKVHPEFYDYLKRRLGLERSPLQESGIGRFLLAAGREAKGALLAFSPFHFAQEGLRAIMSGISPWGFERGDLRTDPELSFGVRHGLELWPDYRGVEAFQEGQMAGHSHTIGKIPGLGKMQAWMNDFLFQKYIPSLKIRAYRSLFERYKDVYKDWSPEKAAQVAARDTNQRFGGINYKQMGRSVATQDLFRVVALAPDWLESEIRSFASMFGEGGKIPRQDFTRMAIGMWAAARVLNYVISGQGHYEAPFGVAWRGDDGKEKIYSVRTLPGDFFHAVSDPAGFLAGRQAPLAKTATEMMRGVDERGHKIPPTGIFMNVARNIAPIPIQTAVKSLSGQIPDVTSGDQVVKALGGTVQPYRTEAQKLAGQIASSHSEMGEVDPAQLRRHQAVLELENQMRAGRVQVQDLNQMVLHGTIAPEQAKQVVNNVRQTTGMDPEQARLYSMASRAAMPDFLRIYSAATPEEKHALVKLLVMKRKAYVKHVVTDLTPAERAADPTLRTLQRMFPTQPLF
jgi:hypothetical protein